MGSVAMLRGKQLKNLKKKMKFLNPLSLSKITKWQKEATLNYQEIAKHKSYLFQKGFYSSKPRNSILKNKCNPPTSERKAFQRKVSMSWLKNKKHLLRGKRR